MPNSDLKVLGEKVRKERKLAGLTQEQLAERCHVSTKHIANIEKGSMNPLSYLYFRIFLVIYARMPISYSVENDKAIPKNPTRISRYGFYYRLRFDRTNSDDGTN